MLKNLDHAQVPRCIIRHTQKRDDWGRVSISAKDRKTLWGRSGSRCAICRRPMVAARTADDPEAIVGDEAHIAGQSPGGPRWPDLPPGVPVDAYDNLILLCRVHHKVIDSQPNHYTAARLREIKDDHEKWVSDRLDDAQIPGLYDGLIEPVRVRALTTGAAVWDLIDGSEAFLFTPPDDQDADREAVELADDFLQLCRDYGEVSSDVSDSGMSSVRAAKRSLQDYVSRLADRKLLVFGTTQLRRVPGYEPPVDFRVAILAVVSADSEAILPIIE